MNLVQVDYGSRNKGGNRLVAGDYVRGLSLEGFWETGMDSNQGQCSLMIRSVMINSQGSL